MRFIHLQDLQSALSLLVLGLLIGLPARSSAAGILAQGTAGDEAEADDPNRVPLSRVRKYESWVEAYRMGRVLLVKSGVLDESAVRNFRELFEAIAEGKDLVAAKRLWRAATIEIDQKIVDKHAVLAAQVGRVRHYAIELIAGIEDAAIDGWLMKMGLRRGAKADLERTIALDVLSRRNTEGLDEVLLRNIRKFAIPERITAVFALERVGGDSSIPVLMKMLKEREPNLRIAVIQSLGGILSKYSDETREENLRGDSLGRKWTKKVVDSLLSVLRSERIWQVRMTICDAFVQLKNRLSVPALIKGFSMEVGRGKQSNPILEAAFHDGLVMMTNKDLPEGAPHLWEDFWKKEGRDFRYVARRTKGAKKYTMAKKMSLGYVKYFNMSIRSKRLIFIVDFSGSMAEKVSLADGYGRGKHEMKYLLVQRELEKVIRALPSDTICNVVFFNNEVSVWRPGDKGRPKLIKMTDDNKSSLLQYIWNTAPSGSTNVHGSLMTALGMADRGIYDKYYKTAFDTIYFLSDGGPTAGETTDTDEILRAVRKINKLRRVRINAIAFGDEKNNTTFLRRLAEDNGGRFLHLK
ncbi:MAG: VWA domain-containing protein [Planctomycetota bacterium]